MCIVYVLDYVIRLHKLRVEPVQKYRLIETIDWTPIFTDTVKPTIWMELECFVALTNLVM